MATRYTYKMLCKDISELNDKLEQAGSGFFLEAGHRYNYSAVDVLTSRQYDYRKGDKTGHSSINCNLETGSPRDCLQAAERFYWQQLMSINKSV